MNKVPDTAMTEAELDVVRLVAKVYGISEQEAQDCLAKSGLARRVKKRTGKSPAKVYGIRRGRG